ncbi:MAG: GTPase HflX, partial [Candidatus Omnitrophota bacterium]
MAGSKLKETKEKREKAVLVTVIETGKEEFRNLGDREEELRGLARACGVNVVAGCTCRRKALTANLFIGRGKVEEIAGLADETDADVVIFNNDLSPSQQKNLEEMIKVKT